MELIDTSWFIIIMTVAVLILTSYISLMFRASQQESTLVSNRLEQLRSGTESTTLKTKLEIQDETLQNIGREIHDNIGSSLTLAKLNLITYGIKHEPQNPQLESSIQLLGEVIEKLRCISRGLNVEAILANGLVFAIEREFELMKCSGFNNVKLFTNGQISTVSFHLQVVLFRITQEALNNVLKHSNAGTVVVKINQTNTFIRLEISDDGEGFVVSKAASVDGEAHCGLINMRHRAESVNGTFTIKSKVDVGTRIIVVLPITKH
jgi:two-component system NarL family sensor kinase